MDKIIITSTFLPGNLENYCKERNIKTIRLNDDIKSIFTKPILLLKLIKDSFKCIAYIKSLRKAKLIVAVFYISIPILILKKLGLIRKSTIIVWAGFFVHNRNYFKYFKKLFQTLFSENDRLILYSKYERKLYADEFNLNINNLYYVPLVYNPGKSIYTDYLRKVKWETMPSNYYFSGGYSHRDYLTLINAFKNVSSNLVVCTSSLNDELKEVKIPPNVQILNDVLKEDFSELIRRSKACLILIKEDTGAAGQLFTLEAMYNQRIVICSSSSILKEMVQHENNGFIVEDAIKEIPSIIQKIEAESFDIKQMGRKAHENVTKSYGKENHNKLMDLALFH